MAEPSKTRFVVIKRGDGYAVAHVRGSNKKVVSGVMDHDLAVRHAARKNAEYGYSG